MAKTPKTKTAGRPVKITEAAHRNHEEPFPNHQSTLKVTDPELIEIFDNFAFDEVLAATKLGVCSAYRIGLHSSLARTPGPLQRRCSCALLLFIGIHNAWDAVTYHVFVRKRGQRETEQTSKPKQQS